MLPAPSAVFSCGRVVLLAAALLVAPERASAHCHLDSPNGGETIRVGSVFTITWTLLIRHPGQMWDLYYSVNQGAGPWMPIVTGLPGTARSYDWHVTLPAGLSSCNTVRVRVVQNMRLYTYEDISDNDVSIVPSLSASGATISLAAGGSQTLDIDAGAANAGHGYFVLGSILGTTPGVVVNGFPLPLVPDPYLTATLLSPQASLLAGGIGTLDASGQATATLVVPAGLPSTLAGLTFYHAAVVVEFVGPPITLISNAASVQLTP